MLKNFCEECGKEITSEAQFYPHYGHQTNKPVVVEQTSKKLKKWAIIYFFMVILSFPTCMIVPATETLSTFVACIGMIMFLCGIVGSILYKFFKWWNHE